MCESLEHELPDGMKLEVLKQIPDKVGKGEHCVDGQSQIVDSCP